MGNEEYNNGFNDGQKTMYEYFTKKLKKMTLFDFLKMKIKKVFD